MLNRPQPTTNEATGSRRGRKPDLMMQQWFYVLCLWLDGEAENECYTLSELHMKMMAKKKFMGRSGFKRN